MELGHLNNEQQLAVTASPGPVCVLAGAGTGKTRVLTNRIAYLIENMNIEPNKILAVTFTKKAAQEMQKRIVKMIDIKNSHPCITTIHAFCLQILYKEIDSLPWLRNDFKIADGYQSKIILNKALKQMNIDQKRFQYQKDDFFDYLRKEKTLKHFPDQAKHMPLFRELYRAIQNIYMTENVLSFDDMLFYVASLFEQNQSIVTKYQNKFEYVLVDEYQDTSPLQFDIISTLTKTSRNLYVVGDNDQSIYGFRGADMGIILSFKDTFPEAQIFKLENNYRSNPNIIKAANSVISNNVNRFDKKLIATHTDNNKINVVDCKDKLIEAKYIAEQIKGQNYNDIAVIIRNNFMSAPFERAFRENNIPFTVYGDKSFFEREEILDIISYLELLRSGSVDDFSRIVNKPSRFISKATKTSIINYCNLKKTDIFDVLTNHFDKVSIGFKQQQINAIKNFYKDLLNLKNQSFSTDKYIEAIMDDLNYKSHIQSIDDIDIRNEKFGNIEELKNIAKSFSDEGHDMKDFISYFYYMKNSNVDDNNQVKIMTIHKSKGLEFSTVFLAAAVDQFLPSRQAKAMLDVYNTSLLEEERRLFYVAITRAMKNLSISSYLYDENGNRQVHSRFIDEIPNDVITYQTIGLQKETTQNIEQQLLDENPIQQDTTICFSENSKEYENIMKSHFGNVLQ